MASYIITQKRSTIGLRKEVREYLKSLGLKKIGSKSSIIKSASSDSLVRKVSHLITYEVLES